MRQWTKCPRPPPHGNSETFSTSSLKLCNPRCQREVPSRALFFSWHRAERAGIDVMPAAIPADSQSPLDQQ